MARRMAVSRRRAASWAASVCLAVAIEVKSALRGALRVLEGFYDLSELLVPFFLSSGEGTLTDAMPAAVAA